jgi:hypothetical protein
MYKRSKVYPNGAPIPDSLPESYQPAAYGNAPPGQSCFTCKSFNLVTRQCSSWDAPVKPRWWCEGWTGDMTLTKPMLAGRMKFETKPALTKKITTSTVEEHFSDIPAGALTRATNGLDNGYEDWYDIGNGETETEYSGDVIKVNVPLLIRLLEYARENAKGDIDLHLVVERMVDLSEEGEVLEMDDYSDIVPEEEKGTEQNGTAD